MLWSCQIETKKTIREDKETKDLMQIFFFNNQVYMMHFVIHS